MLEVRASNTPAIALYEKAGFTLVGKRKNFYSFPKEDALLYNYYIEQNT
jgi:ribosomal-protein-alanine N-acetyltransferase